MYSWEIDQLMKLRNYLIEIKDYINISSTSPQIYLTCYDYTSDNYYWKTNDNYEWTFKVRR